MLDASVLIAWLNEEPGSDPTGLVQRLQRDDFVAVTSPMMVFEVLNHFGRRQRMTGPALTRLERWYRRFGIIEMPPAWASMTTWISRGLTAYDASYVAIADDGGVPLITLDDEVLRLFPNAGRPGEIEPGPPALN